MQCIQTPDPEIGIKFKLNQSGRYAQSLNYVKELASVNGFNILNLTSTRLRLEKGEAVQGWLALLECSA